jgi:hypothetical protein
MENHRQIDVQSPKVGRPTIYSENYCLEVIYLGRQGKSYEQIASILNVGLRTLFSWRDAHVEFRHALRDAKDFEMAFWEDMAQSHLIEHKNAPRLNAGLWSRSMAARFPAKYSERIKKEFSSAHEDTPIRGFQIIFEESKRNLPEPTVDISS